MRYICPCAGYGTRMNMAPNQSKELLIDPKTGYRLIDNTLMCANVTGASVHVITRKEKTDLIEYLSTKKNVTVQIIEPKGEWPETALASKDYWDEHNILILPDTTWSPLLVTLEHIEESLKLGCKSVFALHKVDDVTKWGAVFNYSVVEKPKFGNDGYAWGLIGFSDTKGYGLFSTMRDKNIAYPLGSSSFLFLDRFKDLTRTGKIE